MGFLEFKGEGLRTFQDAQNHDEQLMAVLGARVLFNTKRVAESAEAMQLRMVSEDSILATLSIACSEGLTAALRWVAWWHSGRLEVPEAAEDVELRLNTDFDARGLTAIVAAWQAGALTGEQMGDLLRRGEILSMAEEVSASEGGRRRTEDRRETTEDKDQMATV